MAPYEFSDDPARVDADRVHRWLSEEAYWALGRSREVQDRAAAGSRTYGVYETGTGEQVAYARVVTDGATFAWLCDVFVAAAVRGRRVGEQLLDGVLADLEPIGLRRVLLATADAQTFYARAGFVPLVEPARWMERPAAGFAPPVPLESRKTRQDA